MFLSDLAIRQPVLTTMVTAALVVIGWVGLTRLAVERFPDVFPAVVAVAIEYPGASAEEIENLITKPAEDAVAPVAGVANVHALSSEGVSTLRVEFTLETPKDQAANRVREALTAIRHLLPQGIQEPSVQRTDPALQPMMLYTLIGVSEDQTIDRLRTLIERRIKPQLESIEGVAAVDVLGGLRREIQINLDPNLLAARAIPFDKVTQRVAEEVASVPGGRIKERKKELVLRTRGEIQTVDPLSDVLLGVQDGRATYLRDVGYAYDFYQEARQLTRLNRYKSVSFAIRRQQGSNAIAVADAVRARLAELRKALPADVDVIPIRDDSQRIASAVKDLYGSVLIGTVLVVLVVALFMRDWRSTVIVSLTLPVAVLASFAFLYFLGYSINLMTLMGLSLAIGLIVDDAIVVRENIFRHLEMGKSALAAARDGTAEVGMAVTAATFTIVAVFFPVAFMAGTAGRFYRDLSFMVITTILLSLFVAFTLDPMLSSRFMKLLPGQHGATLGALGKAYRRLLEWSLARRGWMLYGAAVALCLSVLLIPRIGSEFLPSPDSGEFTIRLELPLGSTLNQMNDTMFDVEEYLDAKWHKDCIPCRDIKNILTVIGSDAGVEQAEIKVKLRPPAERTMTQTAIVAWLREHFPKVPGLRVGFVPSGAFGEEIQEFPILLHLRGPDLRVLRYLANEAFAAVAATPGTTDLNLRSAKGKQEFLVDIDQSRAADLGLNVREVAATLRAMVEGTVPARLHEGGAEYDIRVRINAAERRTTEDLAKLTLLTPSGKPVKIESVADFGYGAGYTRLERLNRSHQITIAAQVAPGWALGDVVADLDARLAGIDIPAGYTYEFGSQVRQMVESFRSLYFAIGLAIVLTYMVLASLFGSFVQPLTIMLTLPLAAIGALLALYLGGQTLNTMSLIGVMMLIGLVTKNAILIIAFAQSRRAAGQARREAVVEAALVRLRPILMTSLTTIIAMVPLAIGWGAEFELRQPMAIAIIGGMLSSTLLTLVVIPIVYIWIDERLEPYLHHEAHAH